MGTIGLASPIDVEKKNGSGDVEKKAENILDYFMESMSDCLDKNQNAQPQEFAYVKCGFQAYRDFKQVRSNFNGFLSCLDTCEPLANDDASLQICLKNCYYELNDALKHSLEKFNSTSQNKLSSN